MSILSGHSPNLLKGATLSDFRGVFEKIRNDCPIFNRKPIGHVVMTGALDFMKIILTDRRIKNISAHANGDDPVPSSNLRILCAECYSKVLLGLCVRPICAVRRLPARFQGFNRSRDISVGLLFQGWAPDAQRLDRVGTVGKPFVIQFDTERISELRNVYTIGRRPDDLQNLEVGETNRSQFLDLNFGNLPRITSHLLAKLEHGVFSGIRDHTAPILGQRDHVLQIRLALPTEQLSVKDRSIGTFQFGGDNCRNQFLLALAKA